EESLGSHGPRPDFDVVGQRQDAPLVSPETAELQDQILERQASSTGLESFWHFLKGVRRQESGVRMKRRQPQTAASRELRVEISLSTLIFILTPDSCLLTPSVPTPHSTTRVSQTSFPHVPPALPRGKVGVPGHQPRGFRLTTTAQGATAACPAPTPEPPARPSGGQVRCGRWDR